MIWQDLYVGLSNDAVPKYYGEFRDAVIRGEIPVNREISMEMNRIDALIADPNIFYDESKVEGWIAYCEGELTLVDGSDFHMLDYFKLWGEQVWGWYYFVERSVYEPDEDGRGGHFVRKLIKKRLITKQMLIVGRGAAKTLYDSDNASYVQNIDTSTKKIAVTAPTMAQADEVLGPIRTAITRKKGPLFRFLGQDSIYNTSKPTGSKCLLASTKSGIVNFITNSIIEIRPMSIDKFQGGRYKAAFIDEWLSGDTREDVIGAIEQGASKNEDYLIVATSSEGNVRNGPGDAIKMELSKILRGEYLNPHVSIFWYKLDDVSEVGDPSMWIKANPGLGKTVSYETYQLEVERMESNPAIRNDTLAKRFGIPMEGYTYYFAYEETIPHGRQEFWQMPCTMGCDLSQGDDFCAFTFLFPLGGNAFGVKTRCYITGRTMSKLPPILRDLYNTFIDEGSLVVMEGPTVLNTVDVYDELSDYIDRSQYEIIAVGYDPYNSKEFIEKWCAENGPFNVDKVIQGFKTETVPLGAIKKLAEDRLLMFDQEMMKYTMGNSITIEDVNGNRMLLKKRYENKIDSVSALMDAYVAWGLHSDDFN